MYSFNGNVQYSECSQHIFNEHLKYVYENYSLPRYGLYKEFKLHPVGSYYLKIGNSILKLTYKKGNVWINLKTDLYKDYENDDYWNEDNSLDGGRAYAYFKRYVKIEDVNIPINTIKIFSYCNKKLANNRYHNVIGYDRNAAYLGACNNLIIPKKLIDYNRSLQENEIGFCSNGIPIYGPCDKICDYIFEAGYDEGLQKWVEAVSKKYINKDINAKAYYQYGIGMLVHHNLPLWNTIINASNNFMTSLLDENTLWSTTDSLVSLKARPDLTIGKIPGEFKIEHDFNDFAFTEHGYQWGLNAPSIKGFSVSKVEQYNKTHKEKFDILLKDKIYIDKSKYNFKKGYIVDEEEKRI